MVGAAGFEPTLTESESGVLPLNYAPMRGVLYNVFFRFAMKIYTFGWHGGRFCGTMSPMNIPLSDIIRFHLVRTHCHIDCVNYFAGLLGAAFPMHDRDKFTEPYQTGYAYRNYMVYHPNMQMLPQQAELYRRVHAEHHRMQSHHVGAWDDVRQIPTSILTEMVCDWYSANFEQAAILNQIEYESVRVFFDRVMSPLPWSDAQREFILARIAELAWRMDNGAVRAIWTHALEL